MSTVLEYRDYGRPFRHILVTLGRFTNFPGNVTESRPLPAGRVPPAKRAPEGPPGLEWVGGSRMRTRVGPSTSGLRYHPLRSPAGTYGARSAVSEPSSSSWDLGGWVSLAPRITHPVYPPVIPGPSTIPRPYTSAVHPLPVY